ncbi:E3 ubiquitin-protein ligase NEURL1 isoform X1 [Hylobates moloch]|uniref:E3 ubiquitin-protein ligase NEURL1 isoform X1 n=1 Tax=Hylobates moloch TaxID=81572 RepID=UPI002674C756|nr:E3 ubiquitin-protein ligase NEURL1 isoform X1 [Hylobates moloch]
MGNNFSSIPSLPRGNPSRAPRGHPQNLKDSIGGPFPVTSHRCHHKQKHCPAVLPSGGLPATPLLFHPHTKGSQILMDLSHKAVKRQASFCNAITFSNRPVLIYEQVRLKITKKQCCWSGALRLGFTSKDPSRIHPDSLPKYACPDLVSQSGFWAKALPEEFANEGNIIAFWVDKKGRVFHRINDSAVMLFFSGVRTADPLWALVDVYGLTRGVQLLDSELVLPDCLRPRSFTALRRPSLRREADDARLSVSLCDLNVPGADGDEAAPAAGCPIPQNSLNSQHSRALPAQLDGDLRFHALRAGAHVRILDEQTVARVEHGRDERALVFTSRPVRVAETIFVKVTRSGGARPGALSFGVTTCDPGTLRPADLPFSPEALVDRKEFWAVCRVPGPLHSGDILGLVVNADGELHLSHNGAAAGMQLCVDASQPLWMLFGLHGTITQIRILDTGTEASKHDNQGHLEAGFGPWFVSLTHSLNNCLLCVYWVPDTGLRHGAPTRKANGQPPVLVDCTFLLQWSCLYSAKMDFVPRYLCPPSCKGVQIKQLGKKVGGTRRREEAWCSRKTWKDLNLGARLQSKQFTSCVALGKALDLSELQFSHL